MSFKMTCVSVILWLTIGGLTSTRIVLAQTAQAAPVNSTTAVLADVSRAPQPQPAVKMPDPAAQPPKALPPPNAKPPAKVPPPQRPTPRPSFGHAVWR